MQVVTILGDGRLVVEFHYTRNIYTIKVLGNGAAENDVIIIEKFETPITPPLFTRMGYEFAGWDIPFPTAMPVTEEGFEIKAQWEIIDYSIGYIITNEYGIPGDDNPNPTSYTVEDEIVLPGLPFLDPNGVFIGWFVDEEMTQPFTEINLGCTGNITLYGLVRYSDEYSVQLEKE